MAPRNAPANRSNGGRHPGLALIVIAWPAVLVWYTFRSVEPDALVELVRSFGVGRLVALVLLALLAEASLVAAWKQLLGRVTWSRAFVVASVWSGSSNAIAPGHLGAIRATGRLFDRWRVSPARGGMSVRAMVLGTFAVQLLPAAAFSSFVLAFGSERSRQIVVTSLQYGAVIVAVSACLMSLCMSSFRQRHGLLDKPRVHIHAPRARLVVAVALAARHGIEFVLFVMCLRGAGVLAQVASPPAAFAAFGAASLAGLLSGFPGGIGVFDILVVNALLETGGNRTSVVNAIILFRLLTWAFPVAVSAVMAARSRSTDVLPAGAGTGTAAAKATLKHAYRRVVLAPLVIILGAFALGWAPTTRSAPPTLLTPPRVPVYAEGSAGGYVALGDSYSSGEGVPPFDDDIPNSTECHRSAFAYPRQIAGATGVPSHVSFAACSGATTSDLFRQVRKMSDQANQLASLVSHETTLITLTVGGDDIGFSKIARTCVKTGPSLAPIANGAANPDYIAHCQSVIGPDISRRLAALEDDLIALYRSIQRAAPQAQIFVIGYPRIVPTAATQDCSGWVWREDGAPGSRFGVQAHWKIESDVAAWVAGIVTALNDVIEHASAAVGLHFVDVEDAFSGHEICPNGRVYPDDTSPAEVPWANGVLVDRHLDVSTYSFHPNGLGQQRLAQIVRVAIAGIVKPTN